MSHILPQANPVAYIRETSEILGKTLNHDDSVNDRAVGSKLSNASQTTAKLWRETFGEDFRSSGKIREDMLGLSCAKLRLTNMNCPCLVNKTWTIHKKRMHISGASC